MTEMEGEWMNSDKQGGAQYSAEKSIDHLFFGLALIVFFLRIIGLITDWYWFEEVGYVNVFTVALWAQLKMALIFGVAVFAIIYGTSSRLCVFLQVSM